MLSQRLVMCGILIALLVPGCLSLKKSPQETSLPNQPSEELPAKSCPTPTTPTSHPSTPTPTPLPTHTPVPGIAPTPFVLNVKIETDKAGYLIGEGVKIKLVLENHLPNEIAVQFPPEIRIEGMFGYKIYPARDKIKLQPGKSVSFDIEWDQKVDGKQALPGSYEIRVSPTRIEDCNNCFLSGYKRIVITYPQGSLNKTLNLNLAKDGLKLKKIVFNQDKTEIHVQTDVAVVRDVLAPLPTPPDVLMSYELSMKVDGVEYPVKQYGYTSDGNWTIIFLSTPLPSDAEIMELKLKNSKSCEFNVSLNRTYLD